MENTMESMLDQYLKDQYAFYLRKSRTDLELEALGEGETLQRHKNMLDALAAKHNVSSSQITIYKEMVSGDSIDERPEMQRLLADVYAKKYKAVFVVEIERLARGNTKDQGEVADAFQYSNTHIITPVKTYDPDNDMDQEYFEFGLFMSRREYKTIKRRLESGKWQSVKEGNFIAPTPPYGYDILKVSRKERTLIEKPEESQYVKRIFDWYTIDRKPTSWIAKQLTQMGVPTKKKTEVWSRSTVKDILFNAHYIGKVSWGDQKTIKEKDPVTGKVKKKRIKSGTVQLYEGKHKGFISEEQFARVKEIYGSNASANVNTELVNPLSGIMVCRDCGRAIRFQSYPDNRISRYHHALGLQCMKKSLQADVVIDALVDALNAYIEDFEVRKESDNNDAEIAFHRANIEALEAELKTAERKKKRLFDSWESDDGVYTRDEFIERKQVYVQEIERLTAKIKAAKENIPAPVDCDEQIGNLHAIIECIKDPEMDARTKNNFLKVFIDKITYDSIDLGRGKGGKAVLEVFLK